MSWKPRCFKPQDSRLKLPHVSWQIGPVGWAERTRYCWARAAMWRGSKAAPARPTFLNFVLANDTRDWLNSTGRPAHYVTMSNHVQLIMRIVGLRSASGNGPTTCQMKLCCYLSSSVKECHSLFDENLMAVNYCTFCRRRPRERSYILDLLSEHPLLKHRAAPPPHFRSTSFQVRGCSDRRSLSTCRNSEFAPQHTCTSSLLERGVRAQFFICQLRSD